MADQAAGGRVAVARDGVALYRTLGGPTRRFGEARVLAFGCLLNAVSLYTYLA